MKMGACIKGCVTLTGLVGAVLVTFVLGPQSSYASGVWYVAPGGNDDNTCLSVADACASINAAISKVGFLPGDTIRVAAGTYTSTDATVVVIDKNVTLAGGWNSAFTLQNGTSIIDGEQARRGMMVNAGVTAGVERVAIQNGVASYHGGGIENNGVLTLTLSTVSHNNSPDWYDGGQGDGIYNTGTLTLISCTVSYNLPNQWADGGNSAIFNLSGRLNLIASTVVNNSGLGIHSRYSNSVVILDNSSVVNNGGGGLNNFEGSLTLNNSMVAGNSSSNGGGGGGIFNFGHWSGATALVLNNSSVINNSANTGGGIYNYEGIVILNNSSVSSNTASTDGGGVYNGGLIRTGVLVLNNSTVSNNTASANGGGIYLDHGGMYGSISQAFLNSSTIAANQASGLGGGVSGNSYYTATLKNTILADNVASNGPDCYGTFGSATYNLIEHTSGCAFIADESDLIDVDARLGSLEGSPGYHLPLFGSPAIHAGAPTGCTDYWDIPLLTDQRGLPRVGRCDMGAVEAQALETSIKKSNVSSVIPGAILTYTIVLRNIDPITLGNVVMTDALPASLTYLPNSLGSTAGIFGYTHGVITWTGAISAMGNVSLTFKAQVSQTVDPQTWLVNPAVISGFGDTFTRTATVQVHQLTIAGADVGRVHTGYAFTATLNTITPTLPITYHWQATGQPLVTHTGGLSDSIVFVWDSPSSQTITVTAETGYGSLSAVHSVMIGVPPSDVALNAPTSGSVGATHVLVASVMPLTTTTPITYVWLASEQSPMMHTGGLSDTVAFTWSTTGTKVITLSAANPFGAITDTRVLTINNPALEGISISGPTSGQVGEGYTFTATARPVTTTLPITFVWQATYQPLAIHIGGPSDTLTYSWNLTGTQTITVTARDYTHTPWTDTYVIVVRPYQVYLPVLLLNQ